MGNAGAVIIYVMCVAASCIIGLYVAMYAARCLLVIVDQTAGGNNELTWPDEPMQDWFGQGLHLIWLLIFSFVPAWALGQLLAYVAPQTAPWQWLLFLAAVWLIFPICLLSNLTGHGRWTVLHPKLLRGLVYDIGATLLFFLLSGLILAGTGFLIHWTLNGGGWNLVLLTPVVVAFAWFIYARLLGRIAHLIGNRVWPEGKARKKAAPKSPATNPNDPWAVPEPLAEGETDDEDDLPTGDIDESTETPVRQELEEEEDENDWRKRPKAYGVIFDDDRRDWWERKTTTLAEDPGAYELSTEEVPPPASTAENPTHQDATKPAAYSGPVSDEELERELELRRRGPTKTGPIPIGKQFFVGVFEFPCYPTSLGSCLFLALLAILLSALFRCIQLLQPT
jgi:hypothetical protein